MFVFISFHSTFAFTPVFKKLHSISTFETPKVSINSVRYFSLIEKAFIQKNYKKLLKIYQQSPFFKKEIENEDLLYWLGIAYLHSKKYKKALQFFNKVLEKRKDDPALLSIIGIIYLKLGLLEISEKFLKKAIEKAQQPQYLLIYIGILVKQGKVEEAQKNLEIFEKKFSISEFPWYYYYKGMILLCKNNKYEAVSNFKAFFMLADKKDISRIPEREKIYILKLIKRYSKE